MSSSHVFINPPSYSQIFIKFLFCPVSFSASLIIDLWFNCLRAKTRIHMVKLELHILL